MRNARTIEAVTKESFDAGLPTIEAVGGSGGLREGSRRPNDLVTRRIQLYKSEAGFERISLK